MATSRRKSYVITLDDDDELPSSVLGHHHGPRPETHVKFGCGEADKQAPALIRKLKKHMDILIENFEKISKEHLLAKEDLYRALKEENDLLAGLEKAEDQVYENLFKNGEMSRKYGSCGTNNKSKGIYFNKMTQDLERLVSSLDKGENLDRDSVLTNTLAEVKGLFADSQTMGDLGQKAVLKRDNLNDQVKFYEEINGKLLARNAKLKNDLEEVKHVHNKNE